MAAVPHSNKKFSSAAFVDFYEIKELYRSGAGAVFCARFKYDKKKYVLKERTLPELGRRRDMMNEVNLLSQLDHPNVVRCEGYFRDERRNSLFIVLEYCKGGDLKTYLDSKKAQKKPLDERLIWHIFHQLCQGLKHLHEHGIVHRDLKSMNVMIVRDDKRFNVKLADLGVSRQISDDTMMLQTFYGTPLYLSPELVENKGYNEKTDIWSLGVILYELCVMQHPFTSQTLIDLAKKITAGNYEPLPKNSFTPAGYSALSRTLKWMLSVEYSRRPNCAQLIKFVASQLTAPGYPWRALENKEDTDKGVPEKSKSKKHRKSDKMEVLVDERRLAPPRGQVGGGGESSHASGTADTHEEEGGFSDEDTHVGRRKGANLSGAGAMQRPGTAGVDVVDAEAIPEHVETSAGGTDKRTDKRMRSQQENRRTSGRRKTSGKGDETGEEVRGSPGDRLPGKEGAWPEDQASNPNFDESGLSPRIASSPIVARKARAVSEVADPKRYAAFDLKEKRNLDRMVPVAGVGGWAADGSDFPPMDESDHAKKGNHANTGTHPVHHDLQPEDGHIVGSPRQESLNYTGKPHPRKVVKDEDGSIRGKSILKTGQGGVGPDQGREEQDKYGKKGRGLVNMQSIGNDDQAYIDQHFNAHRNNRKQNLPNRENLHGDDKDDYQKHYGSRLQVRKTSLPNRESDGSFFQSGNGTSAAADRPNQVIKSAPAPAPAPATAPAVPPQERAGQISSEDAKAIDQGLARLLLKKETQVLVRLRKMRDFLGLSEGHISQEGSYSEELDNGDESERPGSNGSNIRADNKQLLADIAKCRRRQVMLERAVDRGWMPRQVVPEFPRLQTSPSRSPSPVLAHPRVAMQKLDASEAHMVNLNDRRAQQQQRSGNEKEEAALRREHSERKAAASERVAHLEEKRGRADPGKANFIDASSLQVRAPASLETGARDETPADADGKHSRVKNSLFARHNVNAFQYHAEENDIKPSPTAAASEGGNRPPTPAVVSSVHRAMPPAAEKTEELSSPKGRPHLAGAAPPGSPYKLRHQPQPVMAPVIQGDAAQLSPRSLHHVNRNNWREADDGNAVNAQYGDGARPYKQAVQLEAREGLKGMATRSYPAAASRAGVGRNDHDNPRQSRDVAKGANKQEHRRAVDADRKAATSIAGVIKRPSVAPRRRDVQFEELYEPAGLMVRGLYKGFEREVGKNKHYASKEHLPPANLGKEREAAVEMFGFNDNKTPRFHRQAPVSSGAAFHAVRDKNKQQESDFSLF